jgi:hypothetical protein
VLWNEYGMVIPEGLVLCRRDTTGHFLRHHEKMALRRAQTPQDVAMNITAAHAPAQSQPRARTSTQYASMARLLILARSAPILLSAGYRVVTLVRGGSWPGGVHLNDIIPRFIVGISSERFADYNFVDAGVLNDANSVGTPGGTSRGQKRSTLRWPRRCRQCDEWHRHPQVEDNVNRVSITQASCDVRHSLMAIVDHLMRTCGFYRPISLTVIDRQGEEMLQTLNTDWARITLVSFLRRLVQSPPRHFAMPSLYPSTR